MQHKVIVNTKRELFPTAEDLYGLFFEDINRAGDGGLYPEMIRNRSFEDSLVPAGCTTDAEQKIYVNRGGWPGAFNHGEGMDDWAEKVPYTEIPGWYSENADMKLDQTDTLNEKRAGALEVCFKPSGKIWNIGYAGVPIRTGERADFYLFVKTEAAFCLKVSLEDAAGRVYAAEEKEIMPAETYQRIDYRLTADGECFDGRLVLTADREVRILIGFTSLMPADTYMGHGLRKDLVEMLAGLHPKFMRFPGGCIVEGLSKETAMRFSNTIGPVWERPSHQLMWHYRTTNGLGFHEYLQLCEDLQIAAMYVCNCGMTCQARCSELFEPDLVQEYLQEALDAIEYATGSAETKFGAIRAKMGHPEPFALKYVEIGNENWGPAYEERYQLFYETIKARYPELILISNAHTEKKGLPTEYADEHYYSAPEFFLENDTMFDRYDRRGPKIFLGEYAVNGGKTIASMECAMAEAVFLTGVEKNQDIVKLSAYAPLFQNSDYTAWKPNLIVFDNHQVYGIPSYHVISLFGKYRGAQVVETKTETEYRPPHYQGIPGILCEKPGLQMKNVKINGEPAAISRTIYGDWEETDGVYTMKRGEKRHAFTGKSDAWNQAFAAFMNRRRRPQGMPDIHDFMWVTFGQTDLEAYTFEADLKFDAENAVTMSIWNFHPDTDAGCSEPRDTDWNLQSVRNQIWRIENGEGATEFRPFFNSDRPQPKRVPLQIDYTKFNHYKMVAKPGSYACYINGDLVQEKKLAVHPLIYAAASTEKEQVFLKLINVSEDPVETEVELDCDILPKVRMETVAAALDAVNDMENKERVAAREQVLENGGRRFTVKLAPHSVNVLAAVKR